MEFQHFQPAKVLAPYIRHYYLFESRGDTNYEDTVFPSGHKLVYQHTGLSPKSFGKIHRFKTSLKLIGENKLPLSSIAYDAGYFDQSHFIRDFKSFTGLTPSAYLSNLSVVNQMLIQ